MTDEILSNSTTILQFSEEQRRDFHELLYVGSVLSQCIMMLTSVQSGLWEVHSMQVMLQQFLDWMREGKRVALQWETIFSRLQSVIDQLQPTVVH